MSHILIVTSEMAGRINISVELSRRLGAKGHRVTIASPVDLGSQVAALDATFAHLAPRREKAEHHGDRRSTLRELRDLRERRARAADVMDVDGIAAAIAALAPDAVLVDIELPVHVMAATAARVNVALWTSMLSVWKRPGLPPLHTSITPEDGWRGSRAGIEWAWLRFRLAKWFANQRRIIMRRGADRISVLRVVAANAGFPFGTEASIYDWLIPFTYRTLPVLSFNALELEFPHDPAPNCSYVGPVLSTGGRPTPDELAAARLRELYERRRTGASAALIYCGFGAWHKGDDAGFLRGVMYAVGSHPEWDVIVGLGGRLDPDALGVIPANVHVFPWAPQLEVLEHADLAIHHAGISSVNECIVSGVPMVLYPFDFLDQRGNAARVRYHRLGEVGDRGDAPATIAERIARVLGDDLVRARIGHMRSAFAAYERDAAAVGAIETLV